MWLFTVIRLPSIEVPFSIKSTIHIALPTWFTRTVLDHKSAAYFVVTFGVPNVHEGVVIDVTDDMGLTPIHRAYHNISIVAHDDFMEGVVALTFHRFRQRNDVVLFQIYLATTVVNG